MELRGCVCPSGWESFEQHECSGSGSDGRGRQRALYSTGQTGRSAYKREARARACEEVLALSEAFAGEERRGDRATEANDVSRGVYSSFTCCATACLRART